MMSILGCKVAHAARVYARMFRESASERPAPDFKVGDRVRVRSISSVHPAYHGLRGQIEDLDNSVARVGNAWFLLSVLEKTQ